MKRNLHDLFSWPTLLKGFSFALALLAGVLLQAQTAPVFNNYPSDLTLQCLEEIPSQEVLTATSDCGPVEVSTFTSHTGTIIDSCALTTALGNGSDWSIWLPGLADDGLAPSENWHFQNGASFVTYDDNSGKVSGVIVNDGDVSMMMYVEFWLHNGMGWNEWSALGRSYKDDLDNAGTNYLDWTFFEMLNGFSRISGMGDLAGSELFFSHAPANLYYGFQCGMAANDRNTNEGMSGWFGYTGTFDGADVSGSGDLNVDKECFPSNNFDCVNMDEVTYLWHAEDACGNMTNISQTINVHDTTSPEFTIVPDSESISCENWPIDVFAGVEATDNCNTGILEIVYNGEFVVSESACESVYIRRWTAWDYCENSTTYEQTLTVFDDQAPVFDSSLDNMTIECDDDIPADMLTATDNCSDASVELVETMSGDVCETILTRTFTATDLCGNETIFVQTITIVDTTAPVFDAYDMTLTSSCDEDLLIAILTATDNCSVADVTYEDVFEDEGCIGVIYRNYTAVDACGNFSNAQQIITLTDNEAPVIDNPMDATVECDNIPTAPTVSTTDNCSDVTVMFEETIVEGGCENNYSIVWTWTATDSCDNTSEAVTTITVEDTTSPTWVDGTIPADVTYECSDDIPSPILPQAIDNCDDDVTVEYTEIITDGDCPNTYTIDRMYRGFDNCGNDVLALQTISVVDTTAPEFDVIMDLEMPCDDIEEGIFVTATDNCGEVTITVVDNMNDEGCAGQIIKTYTAIDECGNVTTADQLVVLTDDVAPVFDVYAPEIEAPCGEAEGEIYVTATDNCSDVTITVSDVLVSGGCALTMIKTYTATDACGNTAEVQQIINLIDDQAPEFVSFPIDITIECTDAVPSAEDGEAQISISDNCSEFTMDYVGSETEAGDCPQNSTVTYTWYVIDNCGNEDTRTWTITIVDSTPPVFTFVPETMNVDCSDAIPTSEAIAEDNCGDVTITSEDVESGDSCEMIIVRTFTATDECGNSTSVDQLIVKSDTTAPVLTIQEDMILECDEVVPSEDYSVTDDCSDVNVVVTFEQIAGDCPQAYTLTRTYTATDICGNETVLIQTIIVEDTTAPEFTYVPANLTIDCTDALPNVPAEANDNCDENVTITHEDETIGNSCETIVTRTFTATDDCGNSTQGVQVITLVDVTPPVLSVNANSTIECDQLVPVQNYDVTDDCSDVDVAVTEVEAAGDCPQEYTITRTYVATDECGNSTTMVEIITVVDTTAPQFTFVPSNVTLDCTESLPGNEAEATDNCGDATIAFVDVMEGNSCDMTITRTYTATDECGNSIDAVQVISIVDTTAPSLTIADDAVISCEETIPAPSYTVTDDCNIGSVVVTETITGGDYCYVVTRSYTATDDCGNIAPIQIQTITVEDNIAPIITTVPEDQTYSCIEDVPAFDNWIATDNCDVAPVTSTSWEFLTEDLCGNYEAIVTCSATDACGNTSSVSFTITVLDDIAPEFVNELSDIVIDCDDEVPSAMDLDATDNCIGDLTYLVTDNIIGDLPDADAMLDCDATTPMSDNYDTDWGLMMYHNEVPSYATIVDAEFLEYENGTAHFTATMVSTDNPNAGFFVNVWFHSGMDWAQWSTQSFPTGYKDDFDLIGDNYLDWTYYTLNDDAATMIGWGDYSGSFMTLEHAPSNYFYGFQIGMGGNNANLNYGGGGWFTYQGSFIDSANGIDEFRSGAGDFAWDGDCCPDYQVERTYCVTDCSGNETCFSQMITFDDLDGVVGGVPMMNTVVEQINIDHKFDFVSIAPNPTDDYSLIEYRSNIDTSLRLELFNSVGNKVELYFEEPVKANTTYRKYINAAKLPGGVYMLRLSSDDEYTTRKIVVSK